jgi:hypothetical protein
MNAYQDSQTSGNNSIQIRSFGANTRILSALRGLGPFSSNPVYHAALAGPTQEGIALLEDYEREMLVFQAETEAVLNNVRRCFVMPQDSSVVTFLQDHKTIPQILLEAIDRLRASFGIDTLFALKVLTEEGGPRMLYGVAMWPGSVEDARRALANFDDTWWIAHSRQASGHLTFTYELV